MIWYGLLEGELDADAASVLTEREAALLGPRTIAKRRGDFLRGRWIAKHLLAAKVPGTTVADHEIIPGIGGVPNALNGDGICRDVSVSISHTQGLAAAALAFTPGAVGIDVEGLLANPWAIAHDYFTPGERAMLVGDCPERTAARVWSAKEAVTKVLGEGLRLPLLSVRVRQIGEAGGDGWRSVYLEDSDMCVWSRDHSEWVVSVAAIGKREPPAIVDIYEGA